jgi:hypothetical protein
MKPIPRDPDYGKPPNWTKLYERHFPHRTDPTSRHARVIAGALRDTRSPLRKLLHEAGYEPDHMASALEGTVKMLWEAREKIERLTPPRTQE